MITELLASGMYYLIVTNAQGLEERRYPNGIGLVTAMWLAHGVAESDPTIDNVGIFCLDRQKVVYVIYPVTVGWPAVGADENDGPDPSTAADPA